MKIFGKLFIIAFLLIGSVYVINVFAYFDPLNLCYIKISRHVTSGNDKTIKKALIKIKNEDFNAYKNVCRYTDKIIEKTCLPADPRVNPTIYNNLPPGCYVKGSRLIYLEPQKQENNEVIKERSNLIVKYSQYSKEFWEQHN